MPPDSFVRYGASHSYQYDNNGNLVCEPFGPRSDPVALDGSDTAIYQGVLRLAVASLRIPMLIGPR